MIYDVNNKAILNILNELGEEYKDLLVEKTLSQHHEYDIDRINLSTLVRLDEKTKESLRTNNRNSKINRLSLMLLSLGLVYTLFGLFLFLYNHFSETVHLDPLEKMGFLMVILGLIALLLLVVIRLLPSPLSDKDKDVSKKNHYDYLIIKTWKQIEGLLVQLTPAEENYNLSRMISYLQDLKLLTQSDSSTIKELLAMRNKVVHSDGIGEDYTREKIQELLHDSDSIIKKLEKFGNS